MDALDLIRADHDDLRALLDRYEEVPDGDAEGRGRLVAELVARTVEHSAMEEAAFYPFVVAELPDLEDAIREEVEEHHVIEVLLAELATLDPHHEQYDAKVEVLAENLLHHLTEEEDELFPQLRERLDRQRLVALREDLEAAKRHAPTEPDPDWVGG